MKKIAIFTLLVLAILAGLVFNLGQKKQKKVNCILIVVDALRADHLGCYGYNRDTSPNIDSLAREGILFKSAFSHATITRTSVPSLLTSLYPGVTQVYKLGASLDSQFVTLPEILKKKGYTTAAFVGPQLEGISNLDQKFDYYINPEKDLSIWWVLLDQFITDSLFGWLSRNGQAPFFLYIHYPAVHAPYQVPNFYKNLFWDGDINQEMNNFIDDFYAGIGHEPTDKGGKLPETNLFNFIVSQYDARIRYADRQIGLLLKGLEKLGLLQNTLIIVTADHGEEFMDHGNFFHHHNMYDELLHVPLIMRFPKSLPKNKTIPGLVRHIDVMPTILNILKIRSYNIMQGIDLTPLTRDGIEDNLVSFSEMFTHRPYLGVRTGRWKFIEKSEKGDVSERYELFNLEDDPKEQKNLVNDDPEKTKFFKNRLAEYESSCKNIRDKLLKRPLTKAASLGEEAKKRLKSLGYTE